MSLSKREPRLRVSIAGFGPEALAAALREECPEVEFALLMGSSRDGQIPPGGDLDLAVCAPEGLSFDLLERMTAIARRVAPEVELDVGCFNHAEPVYRFEALKGRLLFARDMDRFLDAFSLTCREYENQMVHYERQARYRLERGEVAA
jgi:hypothetical protein